MAIIHCGFVSHQNIIYKLRLISIAENSIGFVHNEIIYKTVVANSEVE